MAQWPERADGLACAGRSGAQSMAAGSGRLEGHARPAINNDASASAGDSGASLLDRQKDEPAGTQSIAPGATAGADASFTTSVASAHWWCGAPAASSPGLRRLFDLPALRAGTAPSSLLRAAWETGRTYAHSAHADTGLATIHDSSQTRPIRPLPGARVGRIPAYMGCKQVWHSWASPAAARCSTREWACWTVSPRQWPAGVSVHRQRRLDSAAEWDFPPLPQQVGVFLRATQIRRSGIIVLRWLYDKLWSSVMVSLVSGPRLPLRCLWVIGVPRLAGPPDTASPMS